MDIKRIAVIALSALILVSCEKKSSKNYLWGYISPGDFRPYGIAYKKMYSLGFTEIQQNATTMPDVSWKTCGPTAPGTDNPCNVVYATWLNLETTIKVPYEGIALNNSHQGTPTFAFKMMRVSTLVWGISARIMGVSYTNTNVTDDMVTITSSYSTANIGTDSNGNPITYADYSLKDCFINASSYNTNLPPAARSLICGADYVNSGITLLVRTVTFNQNITLTASPPASSGLPATITIHPADSIVAQDYAL